MATCIREAKSYRARRHGQCYNLLGLPVRSYLLSSLQSRRYDTRTTIFSPEGEQYLHLHPHPLLIPPPSGRLYQVEYAMEAIGHAGTCLGILAKDGVLLAAERKNVNKLLDDAIFSEKIYKLDE